MVKFNGNVYEYILKSSSWEWGFVDVAAGEIVDGVNEIWVTGNPDGKLFEGGDGGIDLDHSSFGGASAWLDLRDGELMCYIKLIY